MTRIVEVRRGAGMPLEVGSEIEEVWQFLGQRFEITFVVTEHEPMRRSAVRTASGPVAATGSYTSEETDGGTRFTMQGEADAHGLFKLAEPFLARLARREWEHGAETLKDLLESGAAAASP
jgi:hypothetical protein